MEVGEATLKSGTNYLSQALRERSQACTLLALPSECGAAIVRRTQTGIAVEACVEAHNKEGKAAASVDPRRGMVATRRRTACVGICGQSGCTSLATLISRQRLNAGIGSATARRLSTAKLASLPTIAGGCGARPRLADRSRSRSSCSTDSVRTASAGSRGGCTGSMRLEQGRCSPCCGLPA